MIIINMSYLGDKLSDTIEIFKRTFGLIRQHPKLALPFVFMVLLSIVPIVLIGLLLLFGSATLTLQIAIIFLALLAISLYFINTFFGAVNCWMVSRALKGEEPSFGGGLKRAFSNFFDILTFAVVSFSINVIASRLRAGGGKGIIGMILSVLMRSVAFIIEQGWKYSTYIVLPDMIISERNFVDSLKTVPNIIKKIPEYLAGGFAFDIIMWVVNAFIFMICLVFFGIFWMLTDFMTALIPTIVLFVLLIVIKQVLYFTMKSTYFTVLYVEIYEKGNLTTDFFKGLKVAVKEVSAGVKETQEDAKKFFK